MNTNTFIYINIDNILYQGKPIFYYRKPINTQLHKATEFNNYYEYYYKDKDKEDEIRYLGKFTTFGKCRSTFYYDDYDYPIIGFEKENIFENKKDNIYCKGIPDSDSDKTIINDMEYEGFPVYYTIPHSKNTYK